MKKVRADYSGEPDQLKDEYVYKYFKQSGTFIVPSGITKVDVTVVGGGGSGSNKQTNYSGGTGGGGGYVVTKKEVTVVPNSSISIIVGKGGISPSGNGDESIFGNIIAEGGKGGFYGGDGGSGGGAYGYEPGSTVIEARGGNGGSNGRNGGSDSEGNGVGGTGQGTTTRGIDGILYAGGGGGGNSYSCYSNFAGNGGDGGGGRGGSARNDNAKAGEDNTGGGGGGGGRDYNGRDGGSGIVIIRWLANQSPTITLDSPTSNSPLGASGEFVLSGTIKDEDNDTVTISATINGKKKSTTISATSSTKNWSLKWQGSELSEGTYTNITVTADDGSGGKDTKTYTGTLTVDKTAPIKTNNATINISTNSIKITPHINYDIAGSHATSIKYSWYDKTTSSWIEGNWTSDASFELTELNPNEQYQIRYKARDIVGNESNWLETIERYTLTKIPILELLKATQSTIEGILKY